MKLSMVVGMARLIQDCNGPHSSATIRRATAAVALVLSAMLLVPASAAHDTSKPLTLQSVQELLNGKVPPRRVGQIAQERGIDFALTPAIETQLRETFRRNGIEAAAGDDLLGKLRKLASNAKSTAVDSSLTNAAPGMLVVVTDFPCTWILDGVEKGRLAVDVPAKVPVAFGKHLIRAVTLDGADHWETQADISKPQEEVVAIELNAVRANRQKQSGTEGAPVAAPSAAESADIFADHSSGLVWASRDNGEDVDWNDANTYCQALKLGGYSDWRLPNIDELQKMYDPKPNAHGFSVKGNIALSGGWCWSTTQERPGRAFGFLFRSGKRFASGEDASLDGRALCVRRAGK
ncbi:MAG: DUF1566 domain-containing protein [Terriglobales bacterium]